MIKVINCNLQIQWTEDLIKNMIHVEAYTSSQKFGDTYSYEWVSVSKVALYIIKQEIVKYLSSLRSPWKKHKN